LRCHLCIFRKPFFSYVLFRTNASIDVCNDDASHVARGAVMQRPPKLSAGARVALIAPAGPLRDEEEVERAIDNARTFGWDAVASIHAHGRHGYFSAPDEHRLADLNAALRDNRVDAIWCLRGGYGTMRLLPGIDYDALRRRPRALIGYSDITALHAAVQRECGVVSYHGPTARAPIDEFSRQSLSRALAHEESCGIATNARVLRAGRASGRLAGGNLALIASLVGTPWQLDLDGALLVLEDVNEAVYRVDRMLQQLLLSGSLNGCRAIIFGECTNCQEEADGGGSRTLEAVLTEIATTIDVPCMAGVPLGHIASQWTIPLGAEGEIDTKTQTLRTGISG
jgi:muramoyltetrapeptide carboxypeptidase